MYTNSYPSTSTPSFPSLEHGRLSFPRPRPTLRPSPLSSAKTKSRKAPSESKWEFEGTSDDGSEASNDSPSPQQSRHNTQDQTCGPSGKPPSPPSAPVPSTHNWTIADLQRKVVEDSILIQQLQNLTRELTNKVDTLTNDFRHLLQTVSNIKIGKCEAKKKTRGGRTAVSTLFPYLLLNFNKPGWLCTRS